MFRTAIVLPFRLLGIPVRLDITFLLILPLLAWMIGSRLELYVTLFGLPIDPHPLQQGLMPYGLGLVAALGLFVSVVIHELGHSVIVGRYGIKVKSITLWFLGGVAQFEDMPRQRGAEAIVAIAGPITSLALAAICWIVLRSIPAEFAAAQFVFGYLVYMNAALALFNLLPALPLDGGRVLRSLLALRWPPLQATQISANISRFLAVLLGLFGFLTLNIFLMLIAFFIYMGVSAETQNATVTEMLQGIDVQDLMSREVQTVLPEMRVSDLIQKMFQERHLGYPVLESAGKLLGIVTLSDIQKLKDAGNAETSTTVREIMSPQVLTVLESTSALEAFQKMSRNNFDRMVVVDSKGQMVGIITKTDLIRAIQVRTVDLELLSQAHKGLT
ncbi:CBS domain-containing protein [Candidatus Acetothermia bacterium]|nr:CBS domain-containing protein [Candidatus Acetothermia bacterium]